MPVPTFRRKQENSRLATNPSILISDTEQLIRFEARLQEFGVVGLATLPVEGAPSVSGFAARPDDRFAFAPSLFAPQCPVGTGTGRAPSPSASPWCVSLSALTFLPVPHRTRTGRVNW